MKKRTIAALSLLVAIGASTASALPAHASNPVLHFSSAEPNSPGSDTGSNTSLDGEWVRLKDSSRTTSYDLDGYSVRDRSHHVYTFGRFILRPGASVTLHTGSGRNSSTNRYWGKRWYVWNNTGDTAYLRNRSGKALDSCSWGRVGNGHQVVC